MPLKIAIDLDCTVLNTTERLIEYINERVPVNLKIEDITSYSIEAALPEQYQWIVDSGFRDKEMWRGVQVLPYAADVIKKLYDEGHEIFFATSSLPENLRKKINHLSRNMHLPKEYIERHTININDKYLLEQEKNTRDFSHEMNFLADSKCIEKSVHSGEKSSNKET